MEPQEFRYRHFLPTIILQCLRWYLRYPTSYRQLAEMISERGVEVETPHKHLYRAVDSYGRIVDFVLSRRRRDIDVAPSSC